uniref:Uncharacterized protein n=1 Tax=Arundo donax TaxID=35708 RepID=A0A0A8Y8W8_ARUDO
MFSRGDTERKMRRAISLSLFLF